MLNRIPEDKPAFDLVKNGRPSIDSQPIQKEISAIRQSASSTLVEAMSSNAQIICKAINEAQQVLGNAAGEIQTVFNRKLNTYPDGRTEIDFSTIITISSDGQRRR